MTNDGKLLIYRNSGSRRQNGGKPDVRVDERVLGRLRGGQTVETPLSAGRHRVQVGRLAMGPTGQIFWGSPVMEVEIVPGQEARVRADLTGLRRRSSVSEALFTLTLEGADGGDVYSTPVPATVSGPGHRAYGLLTRALIHKPHPLWSWQAFVSAFVILWSIWMVVAAIFLSNRHGIGRWSGAVIFGLSAVSLTTQWVALYRLRRTLRSPKG